MRISPGELDRRIEFQEDIGGRDAAGDPITVWEPRFKRWAKYQIPRRILMQADQAQVTLRETDVEWIVRQDPQTLVVGPESWSILHRGQRYLIVGVMPTRDRLDALTFRSSTRPDKRGSASEPGQSGESNGT